MFLPPPTPPVAPRRLDSPIPSTARRTAFLAAAIGLLILGPRPATAAFSPLTYDGLPFLTLPDSTNAAVVQIVGDGLVFSRQTDQGVFQGFFATRGESPRALVLPGDADPSPGSALRLQVFLERFAVDAVAEFPSSGFVFAAGASRPEALYLHDGTRWTRLIAPAATLPNSGGATVARYGAPHLAGRALAVAAGSDPEPGFGFQGIYRIALPAAAGEVGALVPVADTATDLPGPVGRPDSFLDDVGFDGTNLVFQAARGPFDVPDIQGLFRQGPDGTIVPLIATGDPLPGGGEVAWLDSAPLINRGTIAFSVLDTNLLFRIVRLEQGTANLVVRDGDPAPEGGFLENVGIGGIVLDGPRTIFAARTADGPGIYVAEAGHVTALISGGRIPTSDSTAVIYPFVNVLAGRDSNLVLQWQSPGGSPRDGLRAALAKPSVPVVVDTRSTAIVAPGGRIELEVDVLGDPPLRYLWSGPAPNLDTFNGSTVVIENASPANTGIYLVAVTNAVGRSALVRFDVQIEGPPFVVRQPESRTVTLGDPFTLTADVKGAALSALRWQRDGEFLVNPGAPNAYGRNHAVLSDAGLYRLVATNAWGSVTSLTARLTLRLPPPAPEFASRRIESLFANGLSVLSAGLVALDIASIDPDLIRWLDDRLALAGANPNGFTPAVFTHLAGGLTVWFRTGVPLPNNLGTLQVARVLPAANAGDPLLILGGTNATLRGLYRIETTSLIPLADLTTTAPGSAGSPDERFLGFPGPTAQAGNRVAFVATTPSRVGVFAWADNTLRRWVDNSQSLPTPGPVAAFPAVGFDGTTAAVLAAGSGIAAPTTLLRLDADGIVSALLNSGDRIPGTASPTNTVARLESPVVENGDIYFQAVESPGDRHLLVWRNGVITRLAGPGTAAGSLGVVEAIETPTIQVDAGRACFTARLRTPAGVQEAILTAHLGEAGEVGFAPVVTATTFEGRAISQLTPLDLEGDRFAFYAVMTDPVLQVVVFANTGTPSRPAPELRLESGGPADWRIPVPDGALLESTPALGEPWNYEPATGAFPLPPATATAPESATFYRLRWP